MNDDASMSLRDLVIAGALGEDAALVLVAPLLDALVEKHREGLVHGALGLDSLRITATGDAAVGESTGPAHRAPEQREGREVDPASDVFSFASVLYTLLAGEPPFADHEPMRERPAAPLPERAKITASLEHLLLTSLAYDPWKRPPDAMALRGRLAGSLPGAAHDARRERVAAMSDPVRYRLRRRAHAPVRDETPRTPDRPRPRTARPGLLSIGALFAVAVVIVALALAWPSSDRRPRRADPPAETPPTPAPRPSDLDAPLELSIPTHLGTVGDRDPLARLVSLRREHRASPRDVAILMELARAYRAAGELPRAVPALRRAVALEPARFEGWLLLSIALSDATERVERDEAVDAIDRALAIEPDHTTALRQRCSILAGFSRSGTEAACDEAIIAAPTDSDLFVARGLHLLREGRTLPARADLNRAIELAPDRADHYVHRAELRAQLFDMAGARADRVAACALGDRPSCEATAVGP